MIHTDGTNAQAFYDNNKQREKLIIPITELDIEDFKDLLYTEPTQQIEWTFVTEDGNAIDIIFINGDNNV